MNKLYAIGVLNCFDNDLVIELVEAGSVKEALGKHSKMTNDNIGDWLADFPDDLEGMKQEAFNGDMAVDVKEVPQSTR